MWEVMWLLFHCYLQTYILTKKKFLARVNAWKSNDKLFASGGGVDHDVQPTGHKLTKIEALVCIDMKMSPTGVLNTFLRFLPCTKMQC